MASSPHFTIADLTELEANPGFSPALREKRTKVVRLARKRGDGNELYSCELMVTAYSTASEAQWNFAFQKAAWQASLEGRPGPGSSFAHEDKRTMVVQLPTSRDDTTFKNAYEVTVACPSAASEDEWYRAFQKTAFDFIKDKQVPGGCIAIVCFRTKEAGGYRTVIEKLRTS